MGFLKKAAEIVLRVTALVSGFAPLVTATDPKTGAIVSKAENELAAVAGVIQQVEVFGQALGIKGPQKLIAATPAVAQVLLASSMLAGKKIANPELFKQGSQKIADGAADILNSLHGDGVVSTDRT
jgi:hypothetical protein